MKVASDASSDAPALDNGLGAHNDASTAAKRKGCYRDPSQIHEATSRLPSSRLQKLQLPKNLAR